MNFACSGNPRERRPKWENSLSPPWETPMAQSSWANAQGLRIYHMKSTEQASPRSMLLIIAVMAVAMLEIIDSTIVNVVLPNMMSALGADQSQVIWVITSYMVASAIVIPLTGYLHQRLGERRLIIGNIIGFILTSSLCGLAPNITTMVIFRFLQGFFGASLIPLSQIILRNAFPKEQLGKAMSIWGAGVMAAPVLGPTLGGYIAEYLNWRWIFYINIPVCLMALALIIATLKPISPKKMKIDLWGVAFLILGTSSLQVVLDDGSSKGWFDSSFIVICTLFSVVGIAGFIYRSLTRQNSAVNIRIFANRNFALATLIMGIFCGTFFGIMTAQPIMQQSIYNYTTMITGLVQAPRGLACSISMILLSVLPLYRVNLKVIMISGLLLCAGSSWYFSNLTADATTMNFILPSIVAGFGMGLLIGPLTGVSLSTIEEKNIGDASGLFSYGRTAGISFGISVATAFLTHFYQVFWQQLAAHISDGNANFQLWLQKWNLPLTDPNTLNILQNAILKHSHLLAYVNLYYLGAIIFILLIPLVFFFTIPKMS